MKKILNALKIAASYLGRLLLEIVALVFCCLCFLMLIPLKLFELFGSAMDTYFSDTFVYRKTVSLVVKAQDISLKF